MCVCVCHAPFFSLLLLHYSLSLSLSLSPRPGHISLFSFAYHPHMNNAFARSSPLPPLSLEGARDSHVRLRLWRWFRVADRKCFLNLHTKRNAQQSVCSRPPLNWAQTRLRRTDGSLRRKKRSKSARLSLSTKTPSKEEDPICNFPREEKESRSQRDEEERIHELEEQRKREIKILNKLPPSYARPSKLQL